MCDFGLEEIKNVREDPTNRKITFGVDSAACRTVVSPDHPATRGYKTHWDSQAGTTYSTAGKSTVEDEGMRLLVAKTPAGPAALSTRKAKVRRPLMSVKDMTNKGQWVVFGPPGGFCYQPKLKRLVNFDNTPTGWDLTVELEAPAEANRRLEEYVEVKEAERTIDMVAETPVGMPDFIRKMISGGDHPFGRQAQP